MRKERKVHYRLENSQTVNYPAAAMCVCVLPELVSCTLILPFFSSHNHDTTFASIAKLLGANRSGRQC